MAVLAEPTSLPAGDPTVGFTWLDKARLALEILVTYARVRWLLLTHRLPRTTELLRERRIDAPWNFGEGELDAGGGWRYALAVIKVLRLVPLDSRCLVRSLVLLSVLARRGAETTLVIGVLAEPEFAAHAWIEHRGVPLLKAGPTASGRLLEL